MHVTIPNIFPIYYTFPKILYTHTFNIIFIIIFTVALFSTYHSNSSENLPPPLETKIMHFLSYKNEYQT